MMIGDKGYKEGYIDYMYRRMNEESEKCKLKDVFMNPLDAARRIVALEKRIDELERALSAERNTEIRPD